MKGSIYLEDGTVYKGNGFGWKGTRLGELVFNTAMTGYQKTLTDPSYKEQIIVMTYPLLGNYGVNDVDMESDSIHDFGVAARDVSFHPSNWRCQKSLDTWLEEMKVPGVYNVDTREITRKIRKEGNPKCIITTEDIGVAEMKRLCDAGTLRNDQMKDAGVTQITRIPAAQEKYNVAVMDLGIKANIIRELNGRGCSVTLFPYGTSADEILESKPDGVLLSNGPGDPEAAVEASASIRKLINVSHYGEGRLPIFGICMGHQLLGLASGGRTYKMKFGHRGGNHGVLDTRTGRSYITSQNHGYAIQAESILLHGLAITHLNLNDGTVEGMQHISKPIFSVQFHPESNPGPDDTGYLFDRFTALMEGGTL